LTRINAQARSLCDVGAMTRLADRPVPRYTSYPTAPHFHAGVGAEAHRGWLRALKPEARLSLYLHLPFCDTLCWYCGCHTKLVARYDPVADYLGDLAREVDAVATALGPGRPVDHVHLGGGTPTILTAADLGALFRRLQTRFAFHADTEVAIEIDPRGLDDSRIEALALGGVTRVSLGVQDLDGRVQRAVNRVQPFEVTASAVARLRAAGIAAINIDLMYGLPHQDPETVVRSVRGVLHLHPSRIALFGYAHVPWMKAHQRLIDESALPDGACREAQALAATRALLDAGYVAIGLDHFALPGDPLAVAQREGRLRRNFQGYTIDAADALIGLGASAIGALPQGYVQNHVPLHAWRDAVRAGGLATARGIVLTDDDRLRRDVIERLMCDLAVNLDVVAARHGGADFGRELEALGDHVRAGLVELDGGRLRVTARHLVRTVAAVFDAHLGAGGARHSRAV
jgi:oxygen-independent coproporphyrinogen III oxidase